MGDGLGPSPIIKDVARHGLEILQECLKIVQIKSQKYGGLFPTFEVARPKHLSFPLL